jgi:hypothetical protein
MTSQPRIGVLVFVGATAILTACAGEARVTGSARAEAAPVVIAGTPTLVAIDSTVWVVRDAERAVYYVDEYYWVHRDDTWYRSRSYDGGWTAVEANVVPLTIVTRNHELYVRYHGEPKARTTSAPRGSDRGNEAEAKNQRDVPPGQEAIPGVGNQRKAEDEQPGTSPFTAKTDAPNGDAPKNEPAKAGPAKKDPPKAEPSKGPGPAPAKKDDAKKDDKKPEAKKK